jgi:hypothetical protein
VGAYGQSFFVSESEFVPGFANSYLTSNLLWSVAGSTYLTILPLGCIFQSPVGENYGKIIVGEKFSPPGLALRVGIKDVRLVLAAADEAAVPMPVAGVIGDHFVSGVARGWGDVDWAVLAKVVAEEAGL